MQQVGELVLPVGQPGTYHFRISPKVGREKRHQQGKEPGYLGSDHISPVVTVIRKKEKGYGAKGTYENITEVGIIEMADRGRECTFLFKKEITECQQERQRHSQDANGLSQGKVGDNETLVVIV